MMNLARFNLLLWTLCILIGPWSAAPARSADESPVAAGEIRLIVRGDDMGSAHAVNEAFVRCYREGVMRSAEVMVPCPWFEEAARLLNENPGIDVGVHLTLTSEWDNVKWRPLTHATSLIDETGNFPQSVWSGYMPGRSSLEQLNPTVEDVEREFRAQIELAMKKIKNVTHLSNHMGGAYRDDLKDVVERLANEYGLLTRAVGAGRCPLPNLQDVPLEQCIDEFAATLKQLQPGLYLIVEHPGLDGPEMRAMGHPGYDNVAQHRQRVTDLFTSQRVKEAIERRGIKLVGYREASQLD